jgi:hypothetical protein
MRSMNSTFAIDDYIVRGRRLKSAFSAADRERELAGPASPWLVSRAFDVLFVCGLAPWIFGLLVYFLVGDITFKVVQTPQLQYFTIAYVVASLLVGEGHQFTSILRYYSSRNWQRDSLGFDRLPFWVMHVGLATVAVILVVQVWNLHPQLGIFQGLVDAYMQLITAAAMLILPTAMALFPVFLMHHFCAQAKGVGLIYCGKARYELSAEQELCLNISLWALVVAGACIIAAPFGSTTLGVGPSEFVRLCGVGFAAFSFILFAIPTLLRGFRRDEWLPPQVAFLWSNLVLFVLLPQPIALFVWLFVPLLYHATQHWAVAWMVQKKEVVASRDGTRADVFRLALPAVATTLITLFVVPSILGSTFGSSTLSLGWSMLIFYMHYFADRAVWRPRKEGE